jgi:hypothetical protein
MDAVSPQNLFHSLSALLKEMDREAITKYSENGHSWPSGLRQYHGHYRQIYGGKDGCEVAWARRLAMLLPEHGLDALPSFKYPPSSLLPGSARQWVDLRITLPDERYLWLEIKGSWPVCFKTGESGQASPYTFGRFSSYLLDETIKDFYKLSRLQPPDAHELGVLLIGFDTPLCTLDNVMTDFEARIPAGWNRLGPDVWTEPHYNTRVQIWLWHREVN